MDFYYVSVTILSGLLTVQALYKLDLLSDLSQICCLTCSVVIWPIT